MEVEVEAMVAEEVCFPSAVLVLGSDILLQATKAEAAGTAAVAATKVANPAVEATVVVEDTKAVVATAVVVATKVSQLLLYLASWNSHFYQAATVAATKKLAPYVKTRIHRLFSLSPYSRVSTSCLSINFPHLLFLTFQS